MLVSTSSAYISSYHCQATDHTFLQKCHYHHANEPLYVRPKMPLPEFTLKHYAGKVTYQVLFFLKSCRGSSVHSWIGFNNFLVQVHKFLDKNFDMVRQDVLDLFIQSKNKVRRHFYMERKFLKISCICFTLFYSNIRFKKTVLHDLISIIIKTKVQLIRPMV